MGSFRLYKLLTAVTIFVLGVTLWADTPVSTVRTDFPTSRTLSFSEFPIIALNHIQGLRRISKDDPSDPMIGLGTEERYIGTLNGERVFVKISTRSEQVVLREAGWNQYLEKEGVLTASFRRLINKDHLGIVMQYVDGVHLPFLHEWGTQADWYKAEVVINRRPKFRVTEQMEKDIRHAYEVFEKLHITPTDVQFRLGMDGRAYLIDTERLHTVGPQLSLRENLMFLSNLKRVVDDNCTSQLQIAN